MRNNLVRAGGVAVSLALTLGLGAITAPSAWANDPDAVAGDVASADPTNFVPVQGASSSDSISVTADGQTASVKTSAGSISIGSTDPLYPSAGFTVAPVFGLRNGRVATDGSIVYDYVTSTDMVVQLTDDASARFATVLRDASAASAFSYRVTFPQGGGSAQLLEGGYVGIYDIGDYFLGGLSVPWARDAAGNEVPTRYEVSNFGSYAIVNQYVDHRALEGVQYPVVADPWLGRNLFSSVTRDTYNGDVRVNATKSRWGQGVHAPTAASWYIFNTYGWNEVRSRQSIVTSKATLKQQYECHVAGGYGNLAGTWNFERFRPTRTVHWTYGVAVHRCNWTTATRY